MSPPLVSPTPINSTPSDPQQPRHASWPSGDISQATAVRLLTRASPPFFSANTLTLNSLPPSQAPDQEGSPRKKPPPPGKALHDPQPRQTTRSQASLSCSFTRGTDAHPKDHPVSLRRDSLTIPEILSKELVAHYLECGVADTINHQRPGHLRRLTSRREDCISNTLTLPQLRKEPH